MLFNSNIDPARFIPGFGVALFLALICLLKWKRRRELVKLARLDRGLRCYVDNQNQQAA